MFKCRTFHAHSKEFRHRNETQLLIGGHATKSSSSRGRVASTIKVPPFYSALLLLLGALFCWVLEHGWFAFFHGPTIVAGNSSDGTIGWPQTRNKMTCPEGAFNISSLDSMTQLQAQEAFHLFPLSPLLDCSKFRLRIKVLTYNRKESLLRCLGSLTGADYEGDVVALDFMVDHTFKEHPNKNNSWTPQAEKEVHGSHRHLHVIDAFDWPHGPKSVMYRMENRGIQPQWLESWWPESLNEFVFVVEDDMEVSPLYYRVLKRLVRQYYYTPSNFDPSVFGIGVHRQMLVAGAGGSPARHDGPPFLYQQVDPWGQVLFPLPWKKFRVWYDGRRHNPDTPPVIAHMKTTSYWENKHNAVWTPWFVQWAHATSSFSLYPGRIPINSSKSLCTNHQEAGVNYVTSYGQDVGLIGDSHKEQQWLLQSPLPPMADLHRFDFCFREVPKAMAVSKQWMEGGGFVDMLSAILGEATKRNNKGDPNQVALVFVPPGKREEWDEDREEGGSVAQKEGISRPGYASVRNWLCHIDGLNLHNYILVVSDPDEAQDLAERGHQAVWIGQQSDKAAGNTVTPPPLVHFMRLVLTALSHNVSVLAHGVNTLWQSNPWPCFKEEEASSKAGLLGMFLSSHMTDGVVYISAARQDAFRASVHQWISDSQESNQESFLDLNLARRVQRTKGFTTLGPQCATVVNISGAKRNNTTPPSSRLRVVNVSTGSADLNDWKPLSATAVAAGLKLAPDVWVIDDSLFSCKAVVCKKT